VNWEPEHREPKKLGKISHSKSTKKAEEEVHLYKCMNIYTYIDHSSKTNQLFHDDASIDDREEAVPRGHLSQRIRCIPHWG